jgi:hypothetical protein
MPEGLTVTQLLAAATDILGEHGYTEASGIDGDSGRARLFEDDYGIVAVYVFDTWSQLIEQWHLSQGQLVDLMSAHLRRAEPKAWEGYLVLLTPGTLPPTEKTEINGLRSDTHRVRKLVATGEALGTLDEVRIALLPLLPLSIDLSAPSHTGLLDLLPELLSQSAIPARVTTAAIDAFTANESILEKLHSLEYRE